MTNNDTPTPMTVRDLKLLLAGMPNDAQLWVFNDAEFTFAPVTTVVHDKRVNGVNLWFTPED
jgi:hypothetical protein